MLLQKIPAVCAEYSSSRRHLEPYIRCHIQGDSGGKVNTLGFQKTSWLHRASIILNTFLLPTDAHNVKKT